MFTNNEHEKQCCVFSLKLPKNVLTTIPFNEYIDHSLISFIQFLGIFTNTVGCWTVINRQQLKSGIFGEMNRNSVPIV